jgi:hypothetical protein
LETREAIIAASACARMIRMRPPKADMTQQAETAQKATWNGRVDFVGPGHLDIG